MDRAPRSLIAAHVATVAVVAAMVLYVFLSVVPRLQDAQRGEVAARVNARLDTCRLIVGLAQAASSHNPKAEASARKFIRGTALGNCHLYASEDK